MMPPNSAHSSDSSSVFWLVAEGTLTNLGAMPTTALADGMSHTLVE